LQKYALLDIGNTNVKLAFVDNGLIQNKIIFETKKFKEKFDDLKLNHISHLFISSVVPELNQYLNNMKISVHFVNSENISNIEIGLNNPSELGADLIINASAAYDLTQQRNLVIDHGTALTFCHVDDKGKYLGCLIFPGNHIASQSLAQFTSKLNYFEMKDTNKLYGTNTEEAIGTGLFK
jgi:type III pantothenate kinase